MTKKQSRVRCNHSGVSVGEYMLISTSIILICIVAFLGFGGNMRAWLMGLANNLEQTTPKANIAQAEVADAQQNSTDQIAQNQTNGSANSGTLRVSPSNPNVLCGQDFCIKAPGLTGVALSTAGSNGNMNITDSAAGVYAQLAQIMKDKGADADSVNLLTRLASQGHNIANLQSQLIQDRSAQRGYLTGSQKFASLNLSDHYQTMTMESTNMEQALTNFTQLSAQMNSSINNYPEEVRPLLAKAANVVMQSGRAFYFWQSRNASGQEILRFRNDGNKASLIHTNSNTICDHGGDQTKCHRS